MNNSSIKTLACSLIMAAMASACSSGASQEHAASSVNNASEAQKSNISKENTFTVGMDPTYAPYAVLSETGKPEGLDVDILNAIAEDQHLKFEYATHDWGDIFDHIDKGEYQIIGSGAGLTAEREAKAAASKPYVLYYNVILSTDDKLGIKGATDLKGLNVNAQSGSPQLEVAKTNGASAIPATTEYLALKELAANRVQANVTEGPVATYILKDFPDLKAKIKNVPAVAKEQLTPYNSYKVFYVTKNNPKLLEKINKGLDDIKQNGKYAAILEKWTGSKTDNAI